MKREEEETGCSQTGDYAQPVCGVRDCRFLMFGFIWKEKNVTTLTCCFRVVSFYCMFSSASLQNLLSLHIIHIWICGIPPKTSRLLLFNLVAMATQRIYHSCWWISRASQWFFMKPQDLFWHHLRKDPGDLRTLWTHFLMFQTLWEKKGLLKTKCDFWLSFIRLLLSYHDIS